MSFNVGRIPGDIMVNPDAGGEGRQRRREKRPERSGGADSVSISDEARRRSRDEPFDEEGEGWPVSR